MIELELWRARIGLYVHKCRRSARVRVKIVSARVTRLFSMFSDQKNELKPPDIAKPAKECKKPQETNSGKHHSGACTLKEEIKEAEQQGTRETPASFLDTTIINLMRMLPLFIILLLLVCGDVELNPGPTLGELMITVCVHEYTCECTPAGS